MVIHANSYGFSVSCTDFSYLYGLTGVGAFPYGFFIHEIINFSPFDMLILFEIVQLAR